MRPDVPYFLILLSLTRDDFARQWESDVVQWVPMHPVKPLK
jgi:hypothetical protein